MYLHYTYTQYTRSYANRFSNRSVVKFESQLRMRSLYLIAKTVIVGIAYFFLFNFVDFLAFYNEKINLFLVLLFIFII